MFTYEAASEAAVFETISVAGFEEVAKYVVLL